MVTATGPTLGMQKIRRRNMCRETWRGVYRLQRALDFAREKRNAAPATTERLDAHHPRPAMRGAAT